MKCPRCDYEFEPAVEEAVDNMGHEFVEHTHRQRHCTVCFLVQWRKKSTDRFPKPQRLCSYMQFQNKL